MSAAFLILIDESGLQLYRRQGKTLRELVSIDAKNADITTVDRSLQQWIRGTTELVLDSPSERFETHRLPPLNPRDRRALLTRKLTRHTRSNQDLHAIIGESNSPRGTRVLSGYLGTPDPSLEACLTYFARPGAPTLRIVTPTLMTDALIRQHFPEAASAEHLLLLIQSPSGIRTVLRQGGTLTFSRFEPLPAGDPAACTRCIAQTLHDTEMHLRQHQDELESPTHLCILLFGDSNQPDCPDVGTTFTGARHQLVTVPSWEQAILPARMHGCIAGQYQTPALRDAQRDSRLGRLMRRSGMASLTLAIGFAIHQGIHAATLLETRQRLPAEIDNLQNEIAAAKAEYPAWADWSSERKQIERFTQQSGAQRWPQGAWQLLAHQLERHPDFKLETLDWKRGASGPILSFDLQATKSPLTGISHPLVDSLRDQPGFVSVSSFPLNGDAWRFVVQLQPDLP